MLVAGLIFVLGVVAGLVICVVTKDARQLLKTGSQNNDSFYTQNHFRPKDLLGLKLFPILIGIISTLTWLQPAYQKAPFYILGVNLILIWLFSLIALIDWFTHLIIIRVLWIGVVTVSIILFAVTFFNPVVGVLESSATNGLELIKAGSPNFSNPNSAQLWPLSIGDSLIGAVVMGFFFGIFYLVGRVIYKSEVFGSGDLLLALLIGFALGFRRSVLAIPLIILASVIVTFLTIVIVYRKSPFQSENRRNKLIAYGPFLCCGAIFLLSFGPIFL